MNIPKAIALLKSKKSHKKAFTTDILLKYNSKYKRKIYIFQWLILRTLNEDL